jgi:hypothetical protein
VPQPLRSSVAFALPLIRASQQQLENSFIAKCGSRVIASSHIEIPSACFELIYFLPKGEVG